MGNIIYDESLLEDGRKYVIYGAGKYGQKVLRYLEMNGRKNDVICFCVSGSRPTEQDIENIPVVCAQEVFMKYPDADYLISGKYMKEMHCILKENTIKKIHILFI